MGAETLSRETAAAWMRRWDAQQERYVADREERFAVLCDVVELAVREVAEPVVLDLGCGPGSLAARLRERLPHAAVYGIDSDPLLLGLARAHYGDAVTWVDADLGGAAWTDSLPETVHAAVSTTALHWLATEELAALYRTLGARTAPGGVLANGDHLGFADRRMNELALAIRDRRATRAGVQDNEEWLPWWDAVLAEPEFAGLALARATRKSTVDTSAHDSHQQNTHHGNGLTVEDHLGLLQAAGFTSAAPMWQSGDDHVLVAVR
ncbi:class I SAM-dependent methyltransferase [Amycolatopsis jiangsuensis]|uniref:SAM-dependent methyltransferase n=1 Tax=Amycolatopsis jiangsuensis TaxID=1181879 RepID=A0A840IRP7_9PSEU|nr:class I SAM-dependent methyltransferase [Amycolatopsis jiangsuensis]MBB4684209.1 SAM-dependent methyltransferase [Amycolatopsis jiangsuensis]